MTITARQLADGQLPNAVAALYTAPADTVTYVKDITLHNTDVVTRACTLWFREAVTGDTRIISYIELDPSFTHHHDGVVVLDTGDSIRGDDDSPGGNVVDYTIFGAEEA